MSDTQIIKLYSEEHLDYAIATRHALSVHVCLRYIASSHFDHGVEDRYELTITLTNNLDAPFPLIYIIRDGINEIISGELFSVFVDSEEERQKRQQHPNGSYQATHFSVFRQAGPKWQRLAHEDDRIMEMLEPHAEKTFIAEGIRNERWFSINNCFWFTEGYPEAKFIFHFFKVKSKYIDIPPASTTVDEETFRHLITGSTDY